MSSCDEDILLIEEHQGSGAPPNPSQDAGDFREDEEEIQQEAMQRLQQQQQQQQQQRQQQQQQHPQLISQHLKRHIELQAGAASSDGSEREQETSDDASKGPKRLKGMAAAAGGGSSDAFKKDREEWSDSAISALLDAYTEKFMQLNKGNLRGRHWQEVSDTVSARCQGQKSVKTIEQCKNKVDSLKKRHKVERTRMESSGSHTSQWPWFSKVEQIVGSAPKLSVLLDDESSMVLKPDKLAKSSASRQRRTSCRTASMSPAGLGYQKSKMMQPRWQRVLLKVSGYAIAGDQANFDPKITMGVAKEVASAMRMGLEVAIVVGGGNFFRGTTWVGTSGLDRTTADHIGMMATMMNSVILQASFESLGVPARIQTAYSMPKVAEPCLSRKAIRHLEKGRVVIFGGGTGNPFFNTDTAAAIRAAEIKAEIMMKAGIVPGLFDCDSKFLDHVSFRELQIKGIPALDSETMQHCEQNGIPVMLFNVCEPGNVLKALQGERVGTLIDQTGKFG